MLCHTETEVNRNVFWKLRGNVCGLTRSDATARCFHKSFVEYSAKRRPQPAWSVRDVRYLRQLGAPLRVGQFGGRVPLERRQQQLHPRLDLVWIGACFAFIQVENQGPQSEIFILCSGDSGQAGSIRISSGQTVYPSIIVVSGATVTVFPCLYDSKTFATADASAVGSLRMPDLKVERSTARP